MVQFFMVHNSNDFTKPNIYGACSSDYHFCLAFLDKKKINEEWSEQQLEGGKHGHISQY